LILVKASETDLYFFEASIDALHSGDPTAKNKSRKSEDFMKAVNYFERKQKDGPSKSEKHHVEELHEA